MDCQQKGVWEDLVYRRKGVIGVNLRSCSSSHMCVRKMVNGTSTIA